MEYPCTVQWKALNWSDYLTMADTKAMTKRENQKVNDNEKDKRKCNGNQIYTDRKIYLV